MGLLISDNHFREQNKEKTKQRFEIVSLLANSQYFRHIEQKQHCIYSNNCLFLLILQVMFAFIPPSQYMGGWPSFLVSLAVIGLLTAIIGDLASIFGCLIGLEDSITAITLVALGTSMPDTFASKTAAVMEKTADSSVGNVNGSNSVNVFLGLGLPWLIASIYWASKVSYTIYINTCYR